MSNLFTSTLLGVVFAFLAASLVAGSPVQEFQEEQPESSLDGLGKVIATKAGFNYEFLPALVSVYQGNILCERINGKLVSINDEVEDLEMIDQVGGRITNDAWTSGRRNRSPGCGKDEFIWTTTGQPITYNKRWGNGEPTDAPDHDCIYYAAVINKGLVWKVGDCSEFKAVICKIPI